MKSVEERIRDPINWWKDTHPITGNAEFVGVFEEMIPQVIPIVRIAIGNEIHETH